MNVKHHRIKLIKIPKKYTKIMLKIYKSSAITFLLPISQPGLLYVPKPAPIVLVVPAQQTPTQPQV